MALRATRRQGRNHHHAQASDRARSYRGMPASVRRGQIEGGDSMSKVDRQALRDLAEKATPGPWWIDSHGELSHWTNDWDASFIAAANPATILALLEEIEALRTCLAETAGVAVTMLYESHKADTLNEFSVEELSRMVDSTKHLA